jgi:hypothetical protein
MTISRHTFGNAKQVVITGSAKTVSRGFLLAGSSGIKLTRLRFDGARIRTLLESTWANTITVADCSFTNAGDFIHVHGGASWTIERNTFRQNTNASASVKFEPNRNLPRIRDVTIADNLFDAPNGIGRSGVSIKSFRNTAKLPQNVVIANNTIVGSATGVVLPGGWDKYDRNLHPVIANNVLTEFDAVFVNRGRLYSNVAEHGTATSGVEIGPLHLNADLSPSPASSLLIDLADPRYAPPRDYRMRTRLGAPDRGAIEYRGSP